MDPDPPQAEQGAPVAPPVPSFASLRDPRRRSPLDVLAPPPAAPEPAAPPAAAEPAAPPTAAPAPRPPDYADLLRLAVHLARWTAGLPVRGLRRLLGA
jgi:hypothetical protein